MFQDILSYLKNVLLLRDKAATFSISKLPIVPAVAEESVLLRVSVAIAIYVAMVLLLGPDKQTDYFDKGQHW